MTAELHMFVADLLHRRGIDDRDTFALHAAKALDGLSDWCPETIRAVLGKVKTDLYRRNPSLSRDAVLDLLSSRLWQRWTSNPTIREQSAVAAAKVLFIASNPVEAVGHHPITNAPLATMPLGLDHEFREIQTKIRLSEHRHRLELVSRWAARPDDLLQALNEERPQVIHFSGHGSDADELILLDDHGRPHPVGKPAIEALLETMKDDIRVVVLNACFSKGQAVAITKHVDCAVGMRREIGDVAAIKFAASFYGAIGFGRSVREAFDQGLVALKLGGIPEDKTPVLRVRKGVDPGKIILVEGSGQSTLQPRGRS